VLLVKIDLMLGLSS